MNRISIFKSNEIRGPIQGLGITSEGQGGVIWSQLEGGKFRFHSQTLKKFLPDRLYTGNIDNAQSVSFKYYKTSENNGIFIGNARFNAISGLSDLNGKLEALNLLDADNQLKTNSLGEYQLLNASINEQGKGVLLLCKEYAISSSLFKPSVYVLQFNNLSELLSASPKLLKEMPDIRGQTFMAGTLDNSGQGLLLWAKDGKSYYQRIKNFNLADSEIVLDDLPPSGKDNIWIQVLEGNGYVAWHIDDGFNIVKVKDYQVLASSKIMLKVSAAGSYLEDKSDFLPVRSWDIQLTFLGDGLVTWISPDNKIASYQKIQAFELKDTPKILTPSTEGLQFGMLRITDNASGPKVIAGLDMKCIYKLPGGICSADSSSTKEIWITQTIN